jgi:hypothetical protein
MKFSIRDLLWFTVVVALALGWSVDRWQMVAVFRRLERRIASEQGGAQNKRDTITALERKLDSVQPGWRRPVKGDPHGYILSHDNDGPVVETFEDFGDGLPNSQAPAPNPPKP